MPKNIIFEKDKVICETEKLDKSGKTVTQSKTMITAGIAKATELVMLNKDGSACPKREIELVFQRENGEYHTARMDISELIDSRKFMNAINHLDIVVFATREEMGLLKRALIQYSKFSSCTQQWRSGIFEENGRLIYVDRNGFVAADDKQWNKSMVAAPRSPYRDLTGVSDVTEETIEEAVAKLHEYGPLNRCAAVIGFAQAAALNWHLDKLGYELPVLYLTGETGAGKTATLGKILQPLTGCEGDKPIMSDALTTFPLAELASRSNIVPLIMDENKASTFSSRNKNCLSNFIRNVYSGARMLRGTKDLNVNEYVMLRPLVLAGETGLEEPALQNRTVTCGFYGGDITPERRDSFDWLASHTDALRAISWKMLRYSLSLTTGDVQEAIDKAMIYVPGTFRQERIRKSFAVILAGYMLFAEKFYTEADIPAAASALADSIYEHVMDSSAVPKTEAIQFLCTLGDMAEADSEASFYLAHGRYYRYDAEEDAIWLNLNNVYPLYCEYCRRTEKDAVPKDALKKQLKHHPEIMPVESKAFHVPGGKTERRSMFRLKALPADTAEKLRLSNQTEQAIQPEQAVQPDQAEKAEQAMQPEQPSQMSLYALAS